MRVSKRKRQQKEQRPKLTWKQRLIKFVIYVLAIFMVFSAIWAIMTHENVEKTKKKKEIAQTCYETMYIASGYTLSYTIDVTYIVKYPNQTAGIVTMAYQANESVDQLNKRKQIDLISSGRVLDQDVYIHQILYYSDGKLITESYNEIGERLSYQEEPSDISFDYNPMLTFATIILEKPGEFRIKNDNKTISGSVSLQDISSFLNLFPYSALFSGVEDNKYFTDQVNKIKITNNNGYFQSAVIDLKNVASTLIGPFYSEIGASVEVSQYTITLNMVSWEQPKIELPEGEINSEGEKTN